MSFKKTDIKEKTSAFQAAQNQKKAESTNQHNARWTYEQYWKIVEALKSQGCRYIKGREEYTLLKEEVSSDSVTEVCNSGKVQDTKNPVKSTARGTGVILPFGNANMSNDTTSAESGYKPFLAPLDVQTDDCISETISSYKAVQSDELRLNLGFDSEFQVVKSGSENKRLVLSLQMTLDTGKMLIRYFFLVSPQFQDVTAEGGQIPLKYCLADILDDLKKSYYPDFPVVLKKNIVYKELKLKDKPSIKVVDYHAMSDSVIPITIICHAGKADISVFRRSKYDHDLLRELSEIQGGWMTVKNVYLKAENDKNYNYYWLMDLCIRDTLGLTPADNKSLRAMGEIINRPKIKLPGNVIVHMADFAVTNPVEYYQYAMNDADIVVSFCSKLFLRNHAIPVTLSSAAGRAIKESIKRYFGVTRKADFDRIYRGLQMLDEGLVPSKDECMKFLKKTRYIPIRDNPDAKLVTAFFEEAYTGGFNASFYIGWITEQTTDFDLQNAYPSAMACIFDLDWSKPVTDFPRNYELTPQDLASPLIPAVAVGDFDFPDTCYCPNIPVPVKDGMNIYPRHANYVYMTGPDMYLALKLGAKIRIFRGFICQILEKDGKPSQCLGYAVSSLVQDRMKAKTEYKDKPLIEKSLKEMVNAGYGKTGQNVSPKTRYSAKEMKRVASEPSIITSPYHAAYTTALVRCMLIACVNQLQKMGYRVYSVTTDGFITNAPTCVVRSLDAYGFAEIFQNARYTLNETREDCEANQVWEPKHYNDAFLNITTRGNVAVNDEGVLAHNSYTTGLPKDTRADRDAYIIAVLTREGRLECKNELWTRFSELVERKHDFQVTEIIREISMNFDYKRCPIVESAVDTPVHYDSADGNYHVDTVIAEFDTRPYNDEEEFFNYRNTMINKNEDCVKTTADLKRVEAKSTIPTKGYIGHDLDRKILLSILMGYRSDIYSIPALDGLKQSAVVKTVNSWNISPITLNDWKNCSRTRRQDNMLPREAVEEMLKKIQDMPVTTEI